MLVGNRIPRDFFVTSGVGESEITVHAGSYHLALRDAGIEMANIVAYSSILPAIATEMVNPFTPTHGEVMECIQAASSCRYGETATAGLTWGWLYNADHERYGGLVCEYSGSMPEKEAHEHLGFMLAELHVNGYDHLELSEVRSIVSAVTPQKMYGTALVALCFTSYVVPVIAVGSSGETDGHGTRVVL
jgi:arginine decarboxylase